MKALSILFVVFASTYHPQFTFSQGHDQIRDTPYKSLGELEEKIESDSEYQKETQSAIQSGRSFSANLGSTTGSDVIPRFLSSSQSIVFCIAEGLNDPKDRWRVSEEDRRVLDELLGKLVAVFSDATQRLKLEDPGFNTLAWKDAIQKQVDLEFQICRQLSESMPPSELEHYFQAHRAKILTSNLWFAVYSGYLECDKETVELAKRKREDLLLILARSNKEGKAPAINEMFSITKEVIDRLTLEQYLSLLVIRGEKSTDVSSKKFMSMLSGKQKERYSKASVAFKEAMENDELQQN